MKQTTIRHLLTCLLLAGLALGACADPGEDGAASGGGPTASAPGSTVAPTTGPPGGGDRVTVSGVVREGVEPGCRLLAADGGPAYLLLGGDRDALRPGRRLEVAGRLAPKVLSYCQQGMPLQVTGVRSVG
jgi:hypothetical protein